MRGSKSYASSKFSETEFDNVLSTGSGTSQQYPVYMTQTVQYQLLGAVPPQQYLVYRPQTAQYQPLERALSAVPRVLAPVSPMYLTQTVQCQLLGAAPVLWCLWAGRSGLTEQRWEWPEH